MRQLHFGIGSTSIQEYTLSQKQFGKYPSIENFPASIERMPVLFGEISFKKNARNNFL
jgi:hypothetical protein